MDFSQRLAVSYYKTIATLNESHKIYLVQHQETHKIYVKKILDVYNKDIYSFLARNQVSGIPQIVELCEEDNQLIVIENYISGCSLQEIIESSRVTLYSIYDYVIELCTILEKMHSCQPPIIHRDIKPSNIIITEYNHVVLLDFNAAKYYTASTNNDTVLLGTKGYAAPEQYGFGSSTPRTDIYALGILLKELSATLSFMPYSLQSIIEKCIQLNPMDRYETVTELKDAIEALKHPNSQQVTVSNGKKSYIPPGFRTKTPWKIVVSVLMYLMIFGLCLSLQVENASGLSLWIQRVFCLIMMLSVVFGCFNYMDIQKYFPLCKHKSRWIHYVGILLLDTIMVSTLFVVMCFLLAVFTMY